MFRSIICAGVFSSGSTWLYNAVIQIAKIHYGEKYIIPFFSNTIDNFPDNKGVLFIVKCHNPAHSIQLFSKFLGLPVIITVRDPRDAICSLHERFETDIVAAANQVTKSASAINQLALDTEHLLLRFEDRFYENRETIRSIARYIGIDAEESLFDDIYENLKAENVKLQIESMQSSGVFGNKSRINAFDPITHWHPNHVGNKKTGKYINILTKIEQDGILLDNKEYCRLFDYQSIDVTSVGIKFARHWRQTISLGTLIMFQSSLNNSRYLISGWAFVEPRFVWAIGVASKILMQVPETKNILSVELRIKPFIIPSKLDFQRLVILVNGWRAYKGRLSREDTVRFELPRRITDSQILRIVMIHPDRARPRDLIAGSGDGRELTLQLFSLIVSEQKRSETNDTI